MKKAKKGGEPVEFGENTIENNGMKLIFEKDKSNKAHIIDNSDTEGSLDKEETMTGKDTQTCSVESNDTVIFMKENNRINQNKCILENISGEAKAGELTAVMGPTGCGKSTLLNILANRLLYLPSAKLHGKVSVKYYRTLKEEENLITSPDKEQEDSADFTTVSRSNDTLNEEKKISDIDLSLNKERNQRDANKDDEYDIFHASQRQLKRISAFLTQEDHLHAFLTVKETLTVAAQFYLPSIMTNMEKEEIINQLLEELGLIQVQDTLIGNDRYRGISGGERKRVAVGIELLCDPSLLFLDEPTSVLDSFQARALINTMKNLAVNTGRTIVLVIHQPCSSVFAMFDNLILLAQGKCIYSGRAQEAISYFSDLGFPLPSMYNPADFLLDLVAFDTRSKDVRKETTARINFLGHQYKERSKQVKTASNNDTITKRGNAVDILDQTNKSKECETTQPLKQSNQKQNISQYYFNLPKRGKMSSWVTQFGILFKRSFKDNIRDTQSNVFKLLFGGIMGIVVGLLYSDLGPDHTSFYDRKGHLFFISINQVVTLIGSYCGTFPKERKLVEKERNSNAYHISAYFIAKVLSELPFSLIGPLSLAITAYVCSDLGELETGKSYLISFLTYLLIVFLECFAALGFALFISSMAPSSELATLIQTPIIVVMFLTSGFYIGVTSLPKGARWLADISIMRWAFQAMLINEFDGTDFDCTIVPETGCIETGIEVLTMFGFGNPPLSIENCLLIEFCLAIIFHFLAFIILRIHRYSYQVIEESITTKKE